MIDYQPLIQRWQHGELECWARQLQAQIAQDFHERRYGNLPKWMQALAQLPEIKASSIDLQQDTIRVGSRSDLGPGQAQQLQTALRSMHPWRKGPFDLFGVHIDTEWRSDWKWNRLAPAVAPLPGRRVLDVGCGSGYHCWRMLGAGAAEVIGIDPSPLFVIQFWALQHYIQRPDIWVLPLGIEHLPGKLEAFDTVFSMGVLYHRRSPIDHLMELRDSLRAGGELVLETLVIEGNSNACLLPSGRYARMSNVWFIPSCDQLANWLGKIGLKNIELVDVTVTRCEEQRSTEWMKFQSLSDFLDPADSSKSIEGYPAPRRAIFTATK